VGIFRLNFKRPEFIASKIDKSLLDFWSCKIQGCKKSDYEPRSFIFSNYQLVGRDLIKAGDGVKDSVENFTDISEPPIPLNEQNDQ